MSSFRDRLRARLKLSVAEVGGLDEYQRAVVGVAAVSNDAAKVDEMLAAAASLAGRLRDAVLVDRRSEVLAFGHEGQGVQRASEADDTLAAMSPDDWMREE